MAFVKEYVLDGNKELFDSFNLYYAGKKSEVYELTSWLVDHERKIYFIELGGGGPEMPTTFALIWQEKKVIIDVEIRVDRKRKETHWLMESIKASKELENQKKEIIQIIKEVAKIEYHNSELIFNTFPEPKFVEEGRLHG